MRSTTGASTAPEALSEAVIASLAGRFAKDERILAVYLLGSAARGTMRPDSDIDIGLLVRPGSTISLAEVAEIAAGLAFEEGRVIDAGIIDSADLVYAREALAGRRIFVGDAAKAEKRASELLALALRFSEDRKEVVDAYGG